MLSILQSIFDKLELSNFSNRIDSPNNKATTKIKAKEITNLKVTNQVIAANYRKKSLTGLPQANDRELQAETITRRVIFLHDIAELNERPQIKNRAFIGCEIRGPTIIIANDSVFNRCDFDGEKDVLFIPVDGDRQILGAIGIEHCKFENCTFVGVGMLVPKDKLSEYLA